MKLCGQIVIDLPIGDYFSAIEHRRRLEDILLYIHSTYPDAKLSIRERRDRKALLLTRATPRAATGALNSYPQS